MTEIPTPAAEEYVSRRRRLYRTEERYKKLARSQMAEIASGLEILVSILVLVGLAISFVPLVLGLPELLTAHNGHVLSEFLEHALSLVIGVEFVKMLAKHSPGSALEVLLYAIARHMVVGGGDSVSQLLGVISIAAIFAVRKFCFVPSFGSTLPGGQVAPDVKANIGEENAEGLLRAEAGE